MAQCVQAGDAAHGETSKTIVLLHVTEITLVGSDLLFTLKLNSLICDIDLVLSNLFKPLSR